MDRPVAKLLPAQKNSDTQGQQTSRHAREKLKGTNSASEWYEKKKQKRMNFRPL